MSRIDEVNNARVTVNSPLVTERVDCKNRIKALIIHPKQWPACKAHEWARALLTLPPDAEILRVSDNDWTLSSVIYICSKEFPVVPEGEEVGEFSMTITKEINGNRVAIES